MIRKYLIATFIATMAGVVIGETTMRAITAHVATQLENKQ